MTATSTQRHIIYDFDTSQFPETKEAASHFGKQKIEKQREALNRLIDSSFQDVFSANLSRDRAQDVTTAVIGNWTVFMYRNRPFLEIGPMHEDELFANGANHLMVTQEYRVL